MDRSGIVERDEDEVTKEDGGSFQVLVECDFSYSMKSHGYAVIRLLCHIKPDLETVSRFLRFPVYHGNVSWKNSTILRLFSHALNEVRLSETVGQHKG